MEKKILDWKEFGDLTEKLIRRINQRVFKFCAIYMIGRGGLILGTILSHQMKLPFGVLLARKVGYNPWDQGVMVTELITLDNLNSIGNDDGYVLFVDEIVDSGKTLEEVLRKFKFDPKRVKVASLFVNEKNCPEKSYPDFYVEKCDKWVVFPWEKEEVLV